MDHAEIFGNIEMNSNSSEAVQLLVTTAQEIPSIYRESQRAIKEFTNRQSKEKLQLPKQVIDLHYAAFSQAASSANISGDCLITFYTSVVKHSTLMTYSPFVLIRTAIESARYAQWLLEDVSSTPLLKRGYAAKFKGLKEILDYLNAKKNAGRMTLEDQQRSMLLTKEYEQLIRYGRENGLLKRGKRSRSFEPIDPVPSATLLFSSIYGPEGLTNVSHIFAQLSGISHGLDWASSLSTERTVVSFSPELATDGVFNKVTLSTAVKPDDMIIPLQVALLQLAKLGNLFHDAAENY